MRHSRIAGAAMAVLFLTVVAGEDDGLTITLSKTAVPGEVRIDFSGQAPNYQVYRSVDPVLIPGRNTRIGETSTLVYVDNTPPPEDLLFYVSSSRPQVLLHLMNSSQDLAGYMETYREVQDLTPYSFESINPAQFLNMASKSILAVGTPDPFPSTNPPAGVDPPTDMYPAITLQDDFYDRSFSKAEYLALFRQIDDEFQLTGSYPESLVVDGTTAEIRFSQMVYYAAGILRARQFLGYLPERWNRFVISSIDLVPWNVPAGYQEYTSALESDSNPFWWNGSRRYYMSSSHQYSMLKLGREIYGNTKNAYKAGEQIFDWTIHVWQSVVGYSSGRPPFSWDQDGWGRSNYFVHTSGPPRKVISSLFRASGLSASSSGAAYFSNRGWVNIDIHAPYGSDPLENPFYYDDIPPPTRNMPYPTQFDDFIERMNEISSLEPVPPPAGEVTSVYVNPKDVLDYGAPWVLDHLGDFDAVILTVKTLKGYLYFGSTGWPEREQQDALGPLIAEAHSRGKKVYAAVNTLFDIVTGHENADWRQKLDADETETYPNVHVSPCVGAYKAQLQTVLQNLVTGYDVDGVVLDSLYYALIYNSGDTVGHPDCPTGTDWMRGLLRDYAADLAATVRNVDPSVQVVVSTYPQGRNNIYPPFDPADWGHQDIALLAEVADDVMLSFVGTPWVHSDPTPWIATIDQFQTATGRDPWITVVMVDEWEYTPRFYRGVANLARQEGIAGFNLHTTLSAVGELSPAFTRSEWEKISLIRFAR